MNVTLEIIIRQCRRDTELRATAQVRRTLQADRNRAVTTETSHTIMLALAAVADICRATQGSLRLNLVLVIDAIDIALPFPGFFDEAMFGLPAF